MESLIKNAERAAEAYSERMDFAEDSEEYRLHDAEYHAYVAGAMWMIDRIDGYINDDLYVGLVNEEARNIIAGEWKGMKGF